MTLAATRNGALARYRHLSSRTRYTRVQSLWDEIAKSFFGIDYLILTDICA